MLSGPSATADRAPWQHRVVARRARLDGILDRLLVGTGPRLAAVHGPAGSGKSVLVDDWLARRSLTSARIVVRRNGSWRDIAARIADAADQGPVREPLVVVVDHVHLARSSGAPVADPLVAAVSALHDGIRVVFTGRYEPPLPTAGWRFDDQLVTIGPAALRFDDAEALELDRTYRGRRGRTPAARAREVVELNRRVDGWAVLLAALLRRDPSLDDELERLVARYVLDEALDVFDPRAVGAVLTLCVPDGFDHDLAAELLGADAAATIEHLVGLGLLRPCTTFGPTDAPNTTIGFPPLVRDALDRESRTRNRRRWEATRRSLAERAVRRGDLDEAYRHLEVLGDADGVLSLVTSRVLDLVDRGDRGGVRSMLADLPRPGEVTGPGLALDLATAWFFGGRPDMVERHCARAEAIVAGDPAHGAQADVIRLRAEGLRAAASIMDGRLDDALAADSRRTALASIGIEVADPVGKRYATVRTRIELEAGRLDLAAHSLDDLELLAAPPVVAEVIVPALRAWYRLEVGDLESATCVSLAAVDRADVLGLRPHLGALDADLVAARCLVGRGDVERAVSRAQVALRDAETLGYRWPLVRAVAVTAAAHRLRRAPVEALSAVRDARVRLGRDLPSVVRTELALAEAASLVDVGRAEEARTTVAVVPDVPRRRLLLARCAVVEGRGSDELLDLLDGDAAWPAPARLEAEVLRSTSSTDPSTHARVAAVLEAGARAGWVSPFLDHLDRLRAVVDDDEITRRHPALGVHLAASRPTRVVARADPPGREREPLTDRERSVVELLPTHLTYAQIGARLHLSVNTVKTNLKAAYRKLGASTRHDAVERARERGII